MTITLNVFDSKSVDDAITKLEEYSKSLDRKAEALCERLAQMGSMYAEWNFSGVLYAGDIDYTITVDRVGERQYVINANGSSVLFMEFGAGIRHGYGHPKAEAMGYGPGTYPGQKHAMDAKGWWFPDDSNTKGYTHTYGNAPGMPMYNAAQDLKKEIKEIAEEVFRT